MPVATCTDLRCYRLIVIACSCCKATIAIPRCERAQAPVPHKKAGFNSNTRFHRESHPEKRFNAFFYYRTLPHRQLG